MISTDAERQQRYGGEMPNCVQHGSKGPSRRTTGRQPSPPLGRVASVAAGAKGCARYLRNRTVKGPGAAPIWLTPLASALTFAVLLRGQPVQEVTEGTRAIYRGDYQQARTLASRYLETHPQAAMARILLARAEIAQGHYE